MKKALFCAALLVIGAAAAFGIRQHRLLVQLRAELAASATAANPRPAAESAPGPSADPTLSWTVYSADGHGTLSESCTSPKNCRLQCMRLGAKDPVWTVTGPVVADEHDYRFVSDDCAHVWLIYQVPPTAGGIAVTPGAVFLSNGQLAYRIPVPGFVRRIDRLQLLSSHVKWLDGALGIDGRPPHYSDDGSAVEFDTVDGVHHRLAFGLHVPPPELAFAEEFARNVAASARVPAIPGSGNLIEWKDDQGEVHFSQDPSEVPARYRKRATWTSGGSVSVVAGPHYQAPSPVYSFPSQRLPSRASVMVGRETTARYQTPQPQPKVEPSDSNRLWGPGTPNPTYFDYINRIAPPALLERNARLFAR